MLSYRRMSKKDFTGRFETVDCRIHEGRENLFPKPDLARLASRLGSSRKNELGGRDSLILGCYLQNNITEIYSHDAELVKLNKISIKGKHTRITDPIE
jgi:hypothetical protein